MIGEVSRVEKEIGVVIRTRVVELARHLMSSWMEHPDDYLQQASVPAPVFRTQAHGAAFLSAFLLLQEI